MNLSLDTLFNLVKELIDRLGAKTFVAVSGNGLIGYLLIAGHFDGKPWQVVIGVIAGIVSITGLHFFTRISETKIKNGVA